MPIAPLNTKCRELGCQSPKTSRSAFCSMHGGGITVKGKENSQLYSTASWKRQRIIQLSKAPLCGCCLASGRVVQAEHVDHVFPHRQSNYRFKHNLFQSLCAPCHSLKTQAESRGVYLYWATTGLITYDEADYNRVIAKGAQIGK